MRDAVVELEPAVRAKMLERVIHTWGLSASETSDALGAPVRVVSSWRGKEEVPAQMGPVLAKLVAATKLLETYAGDRPFQTIVREPVPELSGRSLIGLVCQARYDAVLAAVVQLGNLWE